MWARISKTIHLSRGERGRAMAYAGLMAVSAGITLKIMSSLEGANAIPPEPTYYDNWAVIAGALSAGISLFLLRKWMGQPGVVGLLRASLGGLMIAFLAAFIAGTLIAPIQGSIMGPALLIVTFMSHAWLAVAWMTVALAAHFLLIVWANERAMIDHRAVSQLSRLSQLNLYGRRLRH